MLKLINKNIDKTAQITIFTFASLIALFITVTSYFIYIDISDMSWCNDNPILLLISFILFCAFIHLFSTFIARSKDPAKSNHILFSVVFCVIMSCTAWWIINAQSLAQNDPQALHIIARDIVVNNDYAAIAPRNSYLSLWPFQSGLLLYYEAILRIIPNFNVVPMECLNWLYLGLGLISGYFLMRKWYPNERIITCWTFLVLFCWPWFFYVNFAYGEIPSISMMFFIIWMLTCYFESFHTKHLLLALLGTGFGLLLRKNMSIFVIAIILLVLVMWFKKPNQKYLLTIASLLLVTIVITSVPQKIYELRANTSMGTGVSAYGYIAMGLQETEGISPGWNNGYHSTTLIENDYNTEITNQINKQSIRDSISYMLKHPDYAIDFFYRKLVPEWCDENFSCLYSTSLIFYNRTPAAWRIYDGTWTKPILQIMNIYQSILYSGFLLFCMQTISRCFKRLKTKEQTSYTWPSLWQLVFIVTLIGGFIFCALWEGGSRYTLPYMICLLPYSAAGIINIIPANPKKA